MNADAAVLRAVLEGDAGRIAGLLAKGLGDRPTRQLARLALAQLWAALEPAERDVASDADAEAAVDVAGANAAVTVEGAGGDAGDPAAVAVLLAGLEVGGRALRALEGPGAGVRPLRLVWVRRPLPERLRLPRVAGRLQALGDALVARCTPRLALSEARVGWFEARCKVEAPGMIRPVRASTEARDGAAGADFELLRKKGRSPFS